MLIQFSGVRLSDAAGINQAQKKSMNMKQINIVDPTFSKNNLGKSISKLNASRVKHGLKLHLDRMNRIYERRNKYDAKQLFQDFLYMFRYTFETVGVHPCLALITPQLLQRE